MRVPTITEHSYGPEIVTGTGEPKIQTANLEEFRDTDGSKL